MSLLSSGNGTVGVTVAKRPHSQALADKSNRRLDIIVPEETVSENARFPDYKAHASPGQGTQQHGQGVTFVR